MKKLFRLFVVSYILFTSNVASQVALAQEKKECTVSSLPICKSSQRVICDDLPGACSKCSCYDIHLFAPQCMGVDVLGASNKSFTEGDMIFFKSHAKIKSSEILRMDFKLYENSHLSEKPVFEQLGVIASCDKKGNCEAQTSESYKVSVGDFTIKTRSYIY